MNNYLVAIWHQFLIVQHLKTLFAPWHRQNPSDFGKRQKTSIDKILDSAVDFYIRLIAAGIRLSIILIGLFWQAILLFVFLVIFVVWLAWPVVTIYMIIWGVTLF